MGLKWDYNNGIYDYDDDMDDTWMMIWMMVESRQI